MNTKELMVFGAVDGLVACMAIVLSLAATSAPAHLIWHAALGLFIAEGLGMAVSEFFGENRTGWREALTMGLSTGVPILAIALPYGLPGRDHPTWALIASICIAVSLAAYIADLRGGGRKGWIQTYAILIGVSGIAALSGAL